MMIQELICPITGLKVNTRPEWAYKGPDGKFSTSFYTIGNSIVYCFPRGRADLEGVSNSLSRNFEAAEALTKYSGKYVQIEDYAYLKGSTPSARKHFLNTLNGSKSLISVIFCNLSPPFTIAVKIGSRFKSKNISTHIARDYKEAVKLALEICSEHNLNQDISSFPYSLQLADRGETLSPMEILYDQALDIKYPEFSNKAFVVDKSILYSKTCGYLESDFISDIENMRQAYQNFLPEKSSIEYIVIDSSELYGSSRKARLKYMQSLQVWHRNHPIRLYIFNCANTFIKTVVLLAKPFMPFKIKVARDRNQVFTFIRNESELSRKRKSADRYSNRRKDLNREVVDKLFTYIGSMDWEQEGLVPDLEIEEDSPYFYLFQSIKLVKEELDILFLEQKKTEDKLRSSLEENQNLFLELQHRVKNSFLLISSMINLMAESRTSKRERNILLEISTKIDAVSNMYTLLYTSNLVNSVSLDEYFTNLVDSFSTTHDSVAFKTRFDSITISVKKVVPLGLIISELITNSYKHAFTGGIQGIITLVLVKLPECIKILYSDNGVGFQISENSSNTNSLGISLIRSLSEQINAELKFYNENGMKCELLIRESAINTR